LDAAGVFHHDVAHRLHHFAAHLKHVGLHLGSAGAAPPIIGMAIMSPIIWRHMSIIGISPFEPGVEGGAGVAWVAAGVAG